MAVVTIRWPDGVPYDPMDEGWSMPQLYDAQAASDMDAGTERRNERFTVNYSRQTFSILMKEEEVKRFATWLVNDARRGTRKFLMPVFYFGDFVERRVMLSNEGPSFNAHGVEEGTKRRMYRVQITIHVEEPLNG